jgi:hypothetical protein
LIQRFTVYRGLQNIHSKWVTAKIFFLKELGPALKLGLGYFSTVLIVEDGVELFCNLYLVCFVGVKWFWSLTSVFAGFLRVGAVKKLNAGVSPLRRQKALPSVEMTQLGRLARGGGDFGDWRSWGLRMER